jgi:IS5 family transposase
MHRANILHIGIIMVRRESRQLSMADAIIVQQPPKNKVLDDIDQNVDWRPLRRRMEKLYSRKGPGRPAYPVVTLFKILLLQSLYNLSDPAAEETIADRLSFRKFLGLNLDESVPDYSTIHRFRDRIAPIIEELFQLLNQQLEAKGYILKKGTIVDASLVKSSAREPGKGITTSSDPDASWTRKGGKLYYGYRMHVGLDEKSELIRRADLSTAKLHDTHRFKAMVSGDEKAVYADKGYYGQKRSAWLAQLGIKDRIMIQANKWHPVLPPHLAAFNRSVAEVRGAVERIFGTLKRHYKFRRCRYRTIMRNRCHFLVLCTCYNLKREIRLQAA